MFGVLAVVAGLVLGGAYAWTSIVLSGAHDNLAPGVYEALTSTTTEGVGTTTPPTAPAKPEGTINILVLGSDRRPDDSEQFGRSDTIMVVHLDPDAGFVSILSLPRDLRVRIPGYGLQKINAAFALGGDALAIKTVREVTGLDFDEYVNVDFEAFRRITSALGGIYVDIDHRYYAHDPSYEPVDVLPGYQRLEGEQALQYVRFRHDLNGDFGRMARQQRFLRAVREQALGWNALVKLPQVAKLLAENTATTMSANDVFKLAYWGAKLRSASVKRVNLANARDANIGGLDYVLASETSIRVAVDDLLAAPEPPAVTGSTAATASSSTTVSTTISTGETNGGETPDLSTVSLDVFNANGRSGEAAATARFLDGLGARVREVGDTAEGRLGRSAIVYPTDETAEAARISEALGIFKLLEDNTRRRVTVFLGADFVPPGGSPPDSAPPVPNSAVWRYLAGAAAFPVMAPAALPEEYRYAGFRLYALETDEGLRDSLRVIYQLGDQDQYLGLMETTFVDAPAASDGETLVKEGLTLTVVGSGETVDRIWWRRSGVLYWLSNTLSYMLDREQMLDVARSMVTVSS